MTDDMLSTGPRSSESWAGDHKLTSANHLSKLLRGTKIMQIGGGGLSLVAIGSTIRNNTEISNESSNDKTQASNQIQILIVVIKQKSVIVRVLVLD